MARNAAGAVKDWIGAAVDAWAAVCTVPQERNIVAVVEEGRAVASTCAAPAECDGAGRHNQCNFHVIL